MSWNTEIYQTLTVLETKVMVYALEECLDEFCISAKDIARGCKMDIKSVKGVVGSLCKKGIMDAEEDDRGGQRFLDLFPFSISGHMVSFGNENLENEDIITTKEWIKENK